ncbi:armadillo-like helical domain-containing protein 4 isoform X2 [Betta splendens]|uniref:Armadillo-like helical domain-containing protein 4 isoform X2 n=1 Tax=Betta splendens TaxID=158456 RepID=A0A6P7LRT5_BETSP|nr:armadillo-like helical domain-containing protein 4 isoform X2 [Betta splendens]
MLKLRLVLLAGICFCVRGTPVRPPNAIQTQDGDCDGPCASSLTAVGPKTEPSGAERVIGLELNVGVGATAGPHGRPEGADPVTQAENGDGLDGISGPSEAGELKKVESTSETGHAERQALGSVRAAGWASEESTSKTQLKTDMRAAFSPAVPPLSISAAEIQEGGSRQDRDPDASSPSSSEPRVHGLTSHRPTSPFASTPLTMWGSEGPAASPLSDPLLPEMGPNLMPKEDGPESLWTEAARPGGADTAVPLSQDEATEGTMSSEALPLIFEDVTPEAAAAVTPVPGGARPPAAMATKGMPSSETDLEQLVTVETDSDGPSHAQPLLTPDWTHPDLLDSRSPPVAVRKPNLLPTTGSSLSSLQHRMTTVATATSRPAHKSRLGLATMESEEEPDEDDDDDDDDDENSEESVEEESEEDLTEAPKTSSTQPPYSFIPPPPVWVQRNQGLMRSWVELIREKAGYVSGMLAPVGIGITGALLIVGALYSIRMIHRKRRNSFKHQRRKQPREASTSRQDQAMLLADSSEDEF